MGLDVELFCFEQVGASRRSVELVAVHDTRFRFAEAIERAQRIRSTPMLDRIDLYGMLELASDEMPQFLDELAQMQAETDDARVHEVLVAVRGLAEHCRDEEDLSLRLVGD